MGLFLQSYPGVPGTPTLINTGGALYDSLDFIIDNGGNSSDTNFAIAISSDNFATTNYVQADDTVSTSPVWQTYTAWGGSSGQRITGLLSSTSYSIKVAARYGPASETGYSNVATAATLAQQLTFNISGVNSGTSIAGETTTVTTSANAINFGSLPVGSPVVAAQKPQYLQMRLAVTLRLFIKTII